MIDSQKTKETLVDICEHMGTVCSLKFNDFQTFNFLTLLSGNQAYLLKMFSNFTTRKSGNGIFEKSPSNK